MVLPAYGFAREVLETGTGSEAGGGQAATEERRAAEAVSAMEDGAEDRDPQRIFRFADRLDEAQEHADDEAEAVPQRLETWITFGLSGETFALPVHPVREVMRVASITRVPHAPEPIRGVTNLRGRVITVIDLRRRIGLQPTDVDRNSRILVVSSHRRSLGLLVDSVEQVVHIDLNKVQPPPEDVMTAQSDYISGVYHMGPRLTLLLDVDRALVIKEAGVA